MTKKMWLLRWFPTGLMILLIFIFSSIPSKEMPEFGLWDTVVKKGGHMLGYAVLTASCWRGMARQERRAGLWAVVFAVGYAITDEFHQSFVPGRHAAWGDVLVDGVGSGLALLAIGFSSKIRQILTWKVV